MRDIINAFVLVVLMLMFFIGILTYNYARYQECRTEHPWWYCIGK